MNAYSIDAIIGVLNELYGGQPLFVVPYQYQVNIGTPAAGTSVTRTLQITSNQDFLLTQINGFVPATEENQSVALESKLLIVENQSGDPFTYGPCPILSQVHFAQYANQAPLMFPRLLQGKSSLSIQWVGGTVAQTSDLTLVFDGLNVRGA